MNLLEMSEYFMEWGGDLRYVGGMSPGGNEMREIVLKYAKEEHGEDSKMFRLIQMCMDRGERKEYMLTKLLEINYVAGKGKTELDKDWYFDKIRELVREACKDENMV